MPPPPGASAVMVIASAETATAWRDGAWSGGVLSTPGCWLYALSVSGALIASLLQPAALRARAGVLIAKGGRPSRRLAAAMASLAIGSSRRRYT